MKETESLVRPGTFLIPREGADWAAWACVACDQFTSQPQYWQEAAQQVGHKPSTLKLIVPECYLQEAAARIPKAHAHMRDYLAQNLLTAGVTEGFILTERVTESGTRLGLIVLVDLEAYDYQPGSTSLIRPSEGTVLERLPPRVQVRQGAALEMSHVLLLVNDEKRTVIEPLYEQRASLPKLYDFSLRQNGGHVTGYAVTQPADIHAILGALDALHADIAGNNPFLYAVGDGNHSLAAAKVCWEALRPALSKDQQLNHPARFALVELENIHCDALCFEPIHRLVIGCDGAALLAAWSAFRQKEPLQEGDLDGVQSVTCICGTQEETVTLPGHSSTQALVALQSFLDAWLPAHPEAMLDYVHGEDAVRALAAQDNAVAFLLPKPDKNGLFDTIRQHGALPRKTFSMGEAHEKRYYLETRKLL